MMVITMAREEEGGDGSARPPGAAAAVACAAGAPSGSAVACAAGAGTRRPRPDPVAVDLLPAHPLPRREALLALAMPATRGPADGPRVSMRTAVVAVPLAVCFHAASRPVLGPS